MKCDKCGYDVANGSCTNPICKAIEKKKSKCPLCGDDLKPVPATLPEVVKAGIKWKCWNNKVCPNGK